MAKARRTGKACGPPAATRRTEQVSRFLLPVALLAAALVYWPCLRAGWLYDDADYVLGDPRLDRLELFWPAHWDEAPPPVDTVEGSEKHLPGYGQPLIRDRYLWRLSFALERQCLGVDPRVAHAVNLCLHLACVASLFLALRALLRLHATAKPAGTKPDAGDAAWRFWPGLTALAFAVHPWAAEPVCYVSARNASLGALFVLLGLVCWVKTLDAGARRSVRAVSLVGVLTCVLAAYASKENLVAAPAGYLLVTWPVLWRRACEQSRAARYTLAAGALAMLGGVAGLGFCLSTRAGGLLAQAGGGRGWQYYYEIQNPILLLTLLDQVPCLRLSLETNHPHWPSMACWAALAANAVLLACGTLLGKRWPILLGLGWFYVFLLPTNSFLPRPDFLAARNVYLPAAGTVAVLAGAAVWLWGRCAPAAARAMPGRARWRVAVAAGPALLAVYWSVQAHRWAECFAIPVRLWARSAESAPDHAAVRLNLAHELARQQAGAAGRCDEAVERELRAALAAEDSPTMRYHTERPKAMRRMLALRMLSALRRSQGRRVEAEELLRQSWAAHNDLLTWLMWLETCAEANLLDRMAHTVAEGLRRWPGEWWPRAARGMRLALAAGPAGIGPEALRDLEPAAQAPNARLPALRLLQVRVLIGLAQHSDQVRAAQLWRRLAELGLPPEDAERFRRGAARSR